MGSDLTRPLQGPETAVFQPVAARSGAKPARLLFDLWRHRALLGRFLARDVQLKYRGSYLGFFWSLLGPLLLMAVYSIVFSVLVRVHTPVPYPLYVLSGLVPWLFTARSMERACHALLDQGPFLQKIYCPREVLVASVVGGQMVELLLSLGVFVLVAAVSGHGPGIGLALLPLCLAAHLALVLGLSLLLSVGAVFFRDLVPILELGLQVWFYLSPVIYPAALAVGLPGGWLYGINPMAGLLEGYRVCLLGLGAPPPAWTLCATAAAALAFLLGEAVFRRLEAAAVKEL
jgi:homopolymeric O-antigen transport system permease protein